jgi:hypothetical protein
MTQMETAGGERLGDDDLDPDGDSQWRKTVDDI